MHDRNRYMEQSSKLWVEEGFPLQTDFKNFMTNFRHIGIKRTHIRDEKQNFVQV